MIRIALPAEAVHESPTQYNSRPLPSRLTKQSRPGLRQFVTMRCRKLGSQPFIQSARAEYPPRVLIGYTSDVRRQKALFIPDVTGLWKISVAFHTTLHGSPTRPPMTPPAAIRSAPARHASAHAVSPAQSAATARARTGAAARRVPYRLVLVIGMLLVAAAVIVATNPAPAATMDASYVRLMRGMAMIKALIVVIAAAVLWWRFARPVPGLFAVGYLLGAWLMVAATALIWQLSTIGAAAIVFHTGELSLLLLAWRDTRSR